MERERRTMTQSSPRTGVLLLSINTLGVSKSSLLHASQPTLHFSPQSHLSNESVHQLFVKPTDRTLERLKAFQVSEETLQTLAATVRASFQGSVMVKFILCLVMDMEFRKNCDRESHSFIVAQIISDACDRITAVTHKADRLNLQSLYQLTQILQSEYLQKFSFHDHPEGEQCKL